MTMNRVLRLLAALALAVVGGVGLAGAASAADPTCTPGQPGYSPGGVCEMTVVTESVCDDGVPTLTYRATASGQAATTLTLTWVNPGGEDVVMTGLPLQGSVPWPGTVVDASGTATDWPGVVRGAGGQWVVGDAFSWARGAVETRFEVNPTVVSTVSYPSGAACAGPVSSVANRLSSTGATVAPLVVGAGALVAAGAAALLVARSRRTRTEV